VTHWNNWQYQIPWNCMKSTQNQWIQPCQNTKFNIFITGGINNMLFANKSLWEKTMSSFGRMSLKNYTSSSENQFAIFSKTAFSSFEKQSETNFCLTYIKKSELFAKCFSNRGSLSDIYSEMSIWWNLHNV
jgi:hypothetical protein